MQKQQGPSTPPAPAAKKSASPKSRPDVRNAPAVLDTQTLRHVSGGTSGPYKTW